MKSINKFNKKGQKHGKWHLYHEIENISKSKLLASGYYVKGSPNGQWLYYNWDGKIATIGSYDKGNNVGLWNKFNKDETMESQTIYIT